MIEIGKMGTKFQSQELNKKRQMDFFPQIPNKNWIGYPIFTLRRARHESCICAWRIVLSLSLSFNHFVV